MARVVRMLTEPERNGEVRVSIVDLARHLGVSAA
jgi:hypothetical protein